MFTVVAVYQWLLTLCLPLSWDLNPNIQRTVLHTLLIFFFCFLWFLFFGQVYLWGASAQGRLSTGGLEAMYERDNKKTMEKGREVSFFGVKRYIVTPSEALNISSCLFLKRAYIPTSCHRGSWVAGRPANKTHVIFSPSWPFYDHWKKDSERWLVKSATSNHFRRF